MTTGISWTNHHRLASLTALFLLAAPFHCQGQAVINTSVGNGSLGSTGDGGPATSATLGFVKGVAVDSAGVLYIADGLYNRIRKVDTSGIITTVAGNGAPFFSGDGGPGKNASISLCGTAPHQGIAVDNHGNLYIADCANNRIRKVNSSGIITTFAGIGGTTAFSGDGGPATSASLGLPYGVAVDSQGNVYIADTGNGRIRKVDTTGIITTVAGRGNGFNLGDGGLATNAQLANPSDVVVDGQGNLYIADFGNSRVRKVNTAGIISTIAVGSFGVCPSTGTYSDVGGVVGLALDSTGNLYMADESSDCVHKLDSSGRVTTVAGGGLALPGDGGPATSAALGKISDVDVDSQGNIFISDPNEFRIRKVTPAAICNIALGTGGQAFSATGGTGSITITTAPGCPWTVGTLPPWVILTSPSSGTGSGTITFQALSNSGGDISGSFTVAGVPFTVEQQAVSISGLNLIGSMAHLAGEENWTTAFTLVNKSAASAQARMSLFGDALDPSGNGPLLLPLTFPQQAAASGPLLAASFDRTLGANASLIVNSAGPQTPPVLVGSAQLAATGPVDGFAIFHQIVTTQEAVVPMETRNAPSYLLVFDNTNGLVLGVALENVSAANALIPVIIRDENGVVISTPGATVSLGGNGHTAFVLSAQFPVTANLRGTIEFDTPAGGRISVLGLRFTPPNNALTTIPALANVGTGGGSIAHLASGGDGWQTTFVLVNTGTTAAQFTLSFFADQTGAPLSLPLSFPQPGGGTDTVTPSVTQNLAAGATRVIVSNGAVNLVTGSAQLTTAGHVSGFVIFRHNNQEAVVPLESRNAGGYIIAFDNTNGTATGIAVNAVSAGQVNIPVTVRDANGATVATDTITLSGNGHYAFTLVNDRYPATANIRGAIEFDAPVGAQIGALGIRIPSGAAHTYTTLPALAK